MNIEAVKSILDEMEGVSGDMYDGSLTMHEDDFRDYAKRIREALEAEEPRRGAGRIPPKDALREVRDRLSYFCSRTDGKYDPPWAQELVGIIDDALTYGREIGNAATMYDTLKEMAADLEDLASRDGMRAPAYSSIFSIYAEKCRKAIAEPPRNCDVYRTSWDVITHYSAKSVARLLDWLLAPAKKGELAK